jgi:dihydroorotate dehydrogenase
LFNFNPESVHRFAVRILKIFLWPSWAQLIFGKIYEVKSPKLEREVFGMKFPNPVGLAAGFDKDAELIDPLSSLGFGFIEIGTLTPKPQPGNEKPRLFRLPLDKALINRMGFNNEGVAAAVERLKKRSSKVIIGGNIGKNKNTPNDLAYRDYEYCFEALYDVVDYFVVNVSSPNTPDLRALQEKEPLTHLLGRLKERLKTKEKAKPLLLKIAPDLTREQVDDIIDVIRITKIDGVIATNTTKSRDGLETDPDIIDKIGAGGLSGKPVESLSTELIRHLREQLGKKFPIIGVGGVFTSEDARMKLEAGADLIQVYTGFIYEGPSIVKNINQGLLKGSF